MSKIHVRLLKEAKKQLKEAKKQLKEYHYVCHAIKVSCREIYDVGYECDVNDYKIAHKETYDILLSIEASIGDSSVSDWLKLQNIHLTTEEMYEYRQQWLDQMIEYWRDKP